MVDIGKIKIKKKIYKFEVKKRSQYVQHYKVKERPPIERIKDAIRGVIAPKKEEKRRAAAQPPPKPGGFNYMVFGAAILIALIVLSIAYIYLQTQVFQLQAGVFTPPTETPAMENAIVESELLSAGTRGDPRYIAGVMVDYETNNINNYSVMLTPFEGRIPSEVFILNSERFEATTYSDFVRTLRNNLSKRKITLNEINIKQMETLPESAIVIVPSGVIPQEFLGFDSTLTMDNLAERGIVVLYIGQPFTKMLNGTLVMTTPSATALKLPFSFDLTSNLQPSEGFGLERPLYRVTGISGWKGALAYGAVSIVKKGDGAFIFVPQTLDGGWSDHTAAASDISRIIFEVPWAESIGTPSSYEFEIEESQYSDMRYFYSQPFESDSATVRVDLIGSSESSGIILQETFFSHVGKRVNSDLYIDGGTKVVPTNITTDLVRVNAQLKEPTAAQKSMVLVISDMSGDYVQTFHQGVVSLQADRAFDIPVYVDRGEYAIRLLDDENQLYAQTYMKVVSIDITRKAIRGSEYEFSVTMDGNPVNLGEVTVTVDDGQYGTHTFTDVSTIIIDVGRYTGNQPLPVGEHLFEFESGELKVDVPLVHTRTRTIFDNPLFWGVVILTVGIVGIGVIFARQESIYFSVDIPDFPPVARTKVPLSPDVVLSIFGKVNENYRWRHTPLTAGEIKNGFRDIFYKGRPIYITDYNVEYLLDELETKGTVKGSLDYYGLSTWEKDTKHTIDYLALMRRLRDICVNNAIPFTGMDKSKDADSVITVVGQNMYLHFFGEGVEPKKVLPKILSTISMGITIILFKSEANKSEFRSAIDSAPNTAPLILKMETDSKSLLFLTPDELEQMLKEFKAM